MNGSYICKVYVVQKFSHDGQPGEVIAVKLAHTPAHEIAKKHAPARVHFVVADKSGYLNVPDLALGQDAP